MASIRSAASKISGDANCFKLLVNAGAKLTDEQPNKHIPALHLAAEYGRVFMMQTMLDAKVDPNLRAEHQKGVSPLAWLLTEKAKHWKFPAELLLKYGADVNARDDQNQTAFFRAFAVGRISAVSWLLSNGADPGIGDNRGIMPVDIARFMEAKKKGVYSEGCWSD